MMMTTENVDSLYENAETEVLLLALIVKANSSKSSIFIAT